MGQELAGCANLFIRHGLRARTDTFADVANNVVVLGAWIVLLWWLWAGGGANQIGHVMTALAEASGAARRYSPRLINLGVTGALLAIALLHLALPTDPRCSP